MTAAQPQQHRNRPLRPSLEPLPLPPPSEPGSLLRRASAAGAGAADPQDPAESGEAPPLQPQNEGGRSKPGRKPGIGGLTAEQRRLGMHPAFHLPFGSESAEGGGGRVRRGRGGGSESAEGGSGRVRRGGGDGANRGGGGGGDGGGESSDGSDDDAIDGSDAIEGAVLPTDRLSCRLTILLHTLLLPFTGGISKAQIDALMRGMREQLNLRQSAILELSAKRWRSMMVRMKAYLTGFLDAAAKRAMQEEAIR